MRRRTAMAVAVVLVTAGCSSAEAESPRKDAYVSLGDSLAAGWQPDEGGGGETSYGYTDALYRSLYDEDSTLEHVRLGCPGEDTTSMLDAAERESGCAYEENSQLEAAETYLEEHAGDIRLVTIGIGANNLTPCVTPTEDDSDVTDGEPEEGAAEEDEAADPGFAVDEQCVEEGLDRLRDELPEIVERLRTAAGDDVQIIGINYYNPFTVAVLTDTPEDEADGGEGEDPTDEVPPGRALAERGIEILGELNDELESAYAAHGVELADIAEAFKWDDFEVPAGAETDMPANAKMVCDHTWMCHPELGPDIHTNDAGALLMAEEIEALVEAE